MPVRPNPDTTYYAGAIYFPLLENASSTLPGVCPVNMCPECPYTAPPTTTAPDPSSDPPAAATPLTVSCLPSVSASQMIRPSFALYARRWPSSPPESTTPGIAVVAADCAGLH